jgi:hypothetical protein
VSGVTFLTAALALVFALFTFMLRFFKSPVRGRRRIGVLRISVYLPRSNFSVRTFKSVMEPDNWEMLFSSNSIYWRTVSGISSHWAMVNGRLISIADALAYLK